MQLKLLKVSGVVVHLVKLELILPEELFLHAKLEHGNQYLTIHLLTDTMVLCRDLHRRPLPNGWIRNIADIRGPSQNMSDPALFELGEQ